ILNIALDPLLIYTFEMGVGGAALATAISQMISFAILMLQSARGGNILPSLRHFSLSPALHAAIIKNGSPTLLRQGLASIAAIVLNTSAGPFGDAAIAAMSIVTRVLMFGLSALLGFGQGFQPVCGFNYGAGRYDRVRRAFWFSVRSSTLVLLLLSLAGLIFAPQIIALFRADDPEVIRIGTAALRFQCVTLPLLSFTILAMMMTQTIGASAKASVLALARQGLFFVPLVLVLPHIIGVTGIQISQPISDLFSFSLSLILTIPILRDMALHKDPAGAKKASQVKQTT
ncbi:MAG: MATE family efflux transporter, partial [Eubacteriales bacterium]|nr:MATE family efflux transporter [Eubacteriales bacterium]